MNKWILISLTLVLTLFSWACIAMFLFHFNILTNSYSYDPRTQTPDKWILKDRPEVFVKQYITAQIDANGTFPPNAPGKVAAIEPTQVEAGGILFNDWQLGITVDEDIRYDNGTIRYTRFMFTSGGSEGFEFGPLAVTYRASGRPLTKCNEISPNLYICF